MLLWLGCASLFDPMSMNSDGQLGPSILEEEEQ
jgi:hypothetical protein